MSNHFAIATVTATLSQLLGGITSDVPGALVTTKPPDVVGHETPVDGLNLFLYHVTPNVGYRNLDQPARGGGGTLVMRPQLGVNLHYIITALAANNNDLQAHRILASAMRILHENPVLSRDMIRQTIMNQNSLTGSDLADQIETVRITMQALTLEEITKLWSSFFQTNYRISVTYEATVVLLDSKYEPKPSLPVLTPQFTTMTIRQPLITAVQPQILEYAANATLAIIGQNFQADNVTVKFGDLSATPAAKDIKDTKITVGLPVGITAGIKTVQVEQNLDMPQGSGHALHTGLKSNVVPFVLAPEISTPPPIQVARGTNLSLSFAPAVAPSQRVSALIGDYEISVPQRDPNSHPITQLSVLVPTKQPTGMVPSDFPTGNFLLRIRVDGAESLLRVDNVQNSPTYGRFTSPSVSVT